MLNIELLANKLYLLFNSNVLGGVAMVVNNHYYQQNRERVSCLAWVKECTIGQFLSFSFWQDPGVRIAFLIAAQNNYDYTFPFKSLHPEAIKHLIVEMYSATKAVVIKHLQQEVINEPIPIVGFNVDKWKSKLSGSSYIGIRIYYYARNCKKWRTFNLSVKEYKPHSSLNSLQACVLLHKWLIACFAEYGLELGKHVDLSATDSGPEVSKNKNNIYSFVLTNYTIIIR